MENGPDDIRLLSEILANNWWSRSPNVTNATNFWNVNTNGGSNNNNANNTNGLAPDLLTIK